MAKTAILTPFVDLAAERVGRRRFWKQILPVTSIDYDGKKIDFDPSFHMDLSTAFKKRAFDQVPIVFADPRNGHNMDPRNFAGDVLDMEYRGDGPDGGTWALIEADRDGAKAISKNPKLGVSARIRQAIEKADGRFFKRGIEHVLLTMNPRVTGMSPWQAVDLAEEDADVEVVDLTAAEYQEGTEMGKTATKGRRQSQPKIDLSALDDDEFKDLLVDLTAEVAERGIEVDDLDDVDDDELDDEEETPTPRRKRSKVKVTKTTEKDEEVDDEDEEDDSDDDDADLSDRVIKRSEVSQFGQMRIDLAKRDWKTKRDQYLAAGVPPVLLDLAEPVLIQPDEMVIDLADSDGKDKAVDFRQILTDMLDTVEGVVDLSDEMGSQIDLTADEEETAEADRLLAAWNDYSVG